MSAPDPTPIFRFIHTRNLHIYGQRGVVHDYVPFYFGYLSPMMLQLKTGQVAGYSDDQDPLIYLVSTCQAVQDSGAGFVFSDGHGAARMDSLVR